MIGDAKTAQAIAELLRTDLPFDWMRITFGIDEENPYAEATFPAGHAIGTALFRAMAHVLFLYPNIRVIMDEGANDDVVLTIW